MSERPPTPPPKRVIVTEARPLRGTKLRSRKVTGPTSQRITRSKAKENLLNYTTEENGQIKVVTGDTEPQPIKVSGIQNEGEDKHDSDDIPSSIHFVHQHLEQGELDFQILNEENMDCLMQHKPAKYDELATYNISLWQFLDIFIQNSEKKGNI